LSPLIGFIEKVYVGAPRGQRTERLVLIRPFVVIRSQKAQMPGGNPSDAMRSLVVNDQTETSALTFASFC
jgi:hypothetical protein